MRRQAWSVGITGLVLASLIVRLSQFKQQNDQNINQVTHLSTWLVLLGLLLMISLLLFIIAIIWRTVSLMHLSTATLILGFIGTIILGLLLGNTETTLHLIVMTSIGLLTNMLVIMDY